MKQKTVLKSADNLQMELNYHYKNGKFEKVRHSKVQKMNDILNLKHFQEEITKKIRKFEFVVTSSLFSLKLMKKLLVYLSIISVFLFLAWTGLIYFQGNASYSSKAQLLADYFAPNPQGTGAQSEATTDSQSVFTPISTPSTIINEDYLNCLLRKENQKDYIICNLIKKDEQTEPKEVLQPTEEIHTPTEETPAQPKEINNIVMVGSQLPAQPATPSEAEKIPENPTPIINNETEDTNTEPDTNQNNNFNNDETTADDEPTNNDEMQNQNLEYQANEFEAPVETNNFVNKPQFRARPPLIQKVKPVENFRDVRKIPKENQSFAGGQNSSEHINKNFSENHYQHSTTRPDGTTSSETVNRYTGSPFEFKPIRVNPYRNTYERFATNKRSLSRGRKLQEIPTPEVSVEATEISPIESKVIDLENISVRFDNKLFKMQTPSMFSYLSWPRKCIVLLLLSSLICLTITSLIYKLLKKSIEKELNNTLIQMLIEENAQSEIFKFYMFDNFEYLDVKVDILGSEGEDQNSSLRSDNYIIDKHSIQLKKFDSNNRQKVKPTAIVNTKTDYLKVSSQKANSYFADEDKENHVVCVNMSMNN